MSTIISSNHQVWKFPIEEYVNQECVFSLTAPGPLHVVHFGSDPTGLMCIWAIVDAESSRPPLKRWFTIMGTGWKAPPGEWIYRGTFVAPVFVWHLFEEVSNDSQA